MDQLPALVLRAIFRHLNFKDRLSVSLVCRNWRKVFRLEKQETLFVHFDLFPYNLRCSHSNELIRYENSVQLKNFNFIRTNLAKFYFEELRKLYIFNIEHYAINVPNLGIIVNQFKKLELLEIIKLRLKEKNCINLPILKVLILKEVLIDQQLELNTFALTTLICWTDIERIKLIYPRKLLHLEYKDSNLDFSHKFANLEHLSYFNASGLTRRDFLANFFKLRKLTVFSPFVQHDLKELRRQKKYYGLDKLEILSFGFNRSIDFPINNNYIYLLDRFKLKELYGNYDSLTSRLPFPVKIDYCSFIDEFRTIPSNFLCKFNQIKQINVTWNDDDLIHNYLPLIKFISKCSFLRKLMLNNCGFRYDFYNLLSLNSSINHLDIIETNLRTDDYSFLSKFIVFHLRLFLDVLPILALSYILQNNNIKYFEFHKKKTRLSIKNCRSQFTVQITNVHINIINKFNCIDNLLFYLKHNDKISFLID